jgi:hypothetical protein
MKPLANIPNELLHEIGNKVMPEVGHIAHSYDILETLMRDASKAYVRQLNEYLESDDPIMVAHSDIASRFAHAPLSDYFEKLGTIRVRNVRGGYSNVAAWRRIK